MWSRHDNVSRGSWWVEPGGSDDRSNYAKLTGHALARLPLAKKLPAAHVAVRDILDGGETQILLFDYPLHSLPLHIPQFTLTNSTTHHVYLRAARVPQGGK